MSEFLPQFLDLNILVHLSLTQKDACCAICILSPQSLQLNEVKFGEEEHKQNESQCCPESVLSAIISALFDSHILCSIVSHKDQILELLTYFIR